LFQVISFPAVFIIISTFSIILGFHVLHSIRKSGINRLFFLVALMLSIWAFGFAIATEAPSVERCLFWRRVAAFGWSTIFALIVHFTFWFTGIRWPLSRVWRYILLYLPAIICVYVFSLSNTMSVHQYRLVRFGNLWVNTQVNNGWDYFFYTYFVCYSGITFFLFIQKYRKSTGNDKQNSYFLLISFVLAITLGSLTDLINSSLRILNIPQMAPIAFLIPITAIYYSMGRHSLMKNPLDNDPEIILSEDLTHQIYKYLIVIPMIGSITFFVSEYLISGEPLSKVLAVSILLILLGLIGVFARHYKIGHRFIEPLFSILAIVSIPLIFSQHFLLKGGFFAWALPFIFIIFSLLFNNRNLLISTSITVFVATTALWIVLPEFDFHINISDYLLFIYFFGMGIWVAFFVHKTYLSRLRETVLKNKLQLLISDVSKRLLSIDLQNLDDYFEQVLSKIKHTYSCDLVILYLHLADDGMEPKNQLWYKENVDTPTLSVELSPQISEYLRMNPLEIGSSLIGGSLAVNSMEVLSQLRLRSLLSIPLNISGTFAGFLAVGKSEERIWNSSEFETLKILVNNLSDSIVKLASESKIEFLAYHDHLTQLPNRTLFTDRADQAIHLAERTGQQVGVVYLDLDSFKTVNDSLGHKIGDELICAIAHQLLDRLRKSDTVSRFGGDEFLLLLQNINHRNDFVKVLDDVMNIFTQPIVLQGQEIFITASAGIAQFPLDGVTTDALVKNADIAMYHAKEKGKNQYLFYSQGMKDEVQYKARLSNLLYRALDRQELMLMYQPQIDLFNDRIFGVEALLRWNQPEMGSISPTVFIPIAEKTGIINSIGEWVLLEACQQLKIWHDRGFPKIRVAVNISVNQLRNPLFVEQVKAILLKTGLEPKYLDLEITESVAIKEPTYIVNLLTKLKELGVGLSIDDFGTEYSSLSRLKHLPVDRIKLDRSFVQGIDLNEKDRAISNGIINLAKSLGLRVIAEGVETPEQLAYLQQQMCDEIQGFLFYRPLPVQDLERVLIKQSHAII
jgi:diguanylate cyclase (GGDEF)-like protein